MNPANITIAVLDRNTRDLTLLANHLEDAGYRVLSASTQAHIERFVASQPVNLVLKGFDAKTVDPLPFLEKIRGLSPDTEHILCGLGGTIHEAVQAIQNGAADYLPKPAEASLLLDAVSRALNRQAIRASDPLLRRSLKRRHEPDFFIGSSPAMQAVGEVINQVAPTDVPVLVTGESGTGKELVARWLHAHSQRREGPFVAVNCAGLTDNLIESELFGHVRGAFTGAIHDRPGAFALAARGTLFLDEIGDLSLKGQGDLLRVLEDGLFHPVGSVRATRADARIVAATNRELTTLTRTGKFREDLLYRLNVVELPLPALRNRTEDLPALVESFNQRFSARHQRQPKKISRAFLEGLGRHAWPGNIRELRNLMERLILTTRSSELGESHLPRTAPAENGEDLQSVSVPAGISLAEAEARLIDATLKHTGGNRSEAARILGISRRTLHYRLSVTSVDHSKSTKADVLKSALP